MKKIKSQLEQVEQEEFHEDGLREKLCKFFGRHKFVENSLFLTNCDFFHVIRGRTFCLRCGFVKYKSAYRITSI